MFDLHLSPFLSQILGNQAAMTMRGRGLATEQAPARKQVLIDRIVAARDLADELKLPKEDYVSLRSEAISALSITDLRGVTKGPGWALPRTLNARDVPNSGKPQNRGESWRKRGIAPRRIEKRIVLARQICYAIALARRT